MDSVLGGWMSSVLALEVPYFRLSGVHSDPAAKISKRVCGQCSRWVCLKCSRKVPCSDPAA